MSYSNLHMVTGNPRLLWHAPFVSVCQLFHLIFFFPPCICELPRRRPIEMCRQPECIQHKSHLESFSAAILLQYSHFPFASGNGKTCECKSITARQSNGNGSVYSSRTALEENVSAFAFCTKRASTFRAFRVFVIFQTFVPPFHPRLEIILTRIC